MAENTEKGGGKMRFMLVRLYHGKSSFTWAEIGAMLKECWWIVAFFVFVFGLRAYLLHREYKQELEEQEEQVTFFNYF